VSRAEFAGADGGFVAFAEKRVMSEESIPVRVALLALRFYKAYLSVLLREVAALSRPCSRYAHEAIERFGVARGIWLGLKPAAALPSALAQIWI